MRIASFERYLDYYYTSVKTFLSHLQERVRRIWNNIFSPSSSYAYAFSQQSNHTCHLDMWKNLHRLHEIRERHPLRKVELNKSDFKALHEWAGEGFADYSKWLRASSQSAVSRYFDMALKEAPIYPDSFSKSTSFTGYEEVERAIFSPYFLKKISSDTLFYFLPMYEEEGHTYCFDHNSKQYERVECKSFEPSGFALTEGQRKGLPPHFLQLRLEKTDGKRSFIKAYDPKMAVNKNFIPQEVGAYKLMLLCMGLDNDNNTIDQAHPDIDVSKDLQSWMNNENISWHSDLCKKEYLIEYALAELFKEDQKLFVEVGKRVDFYFKVWSRYESPERFDKKDLNRKSWSRFLPGKEQMLAFCLMKNVQYLWIKAISGSAFCNHLGLPTIVKYIPLLPGPARYTKAAHHQQASISFIDIWKQVKNRLQQKYPHIYDWVSFSGHGMVLSLDPDLIQQQNKNKIEDPILAHDLGITCIHSLHGKAMDVFYKIKK